MNRSDAAKKMIADDLEAMMEFYMTLGKEIRSYVSLGTLLYTAMIISGSLDWCKRSKISVTSSVNADMVDKLRAKVKLYSDDNVIPLKQQKQLMKAVIKRERQYFVDLQRKSGIPCPKFLIDDIGIFIANGHFIGNTMEYAYEFSPMNPQNLPIHVALGGKTPDKAASYNYAVQMGETIRQMYTVIQGKKFVPKKRKLAVISIQSKDMRMANHLFFRKRNAIFIFNLCCRVNFLLEVLNPLCNQNRFFVFRMIYVTFYHLKNDLDSLKLKNVHYNMPYRNKDFRNAMAHYSLYGKIDDADIKPNAIGLGLFEKFFGETFDTVEKEIINEFAQTRDSLEQLIRL